MSVMRPKIIVSCFFVQFLFISFAITAAAISVKLVGKEHISKIAFFMRYFGIYLYVVPCTWLALSLYFVYKKDPPEDAETLSAISGILCAAIFIMMAIETYFGLYNRI